MLYCNDSLDMLTILANWLPQVITESSQQNCSAVLGAGRGFFLVLKKANQIKNHMLLRPVSHATIHCTGLKPWLKPDIVIAVECIVQHYYNYYYNQGFEPEFLITIWVNEKIEYLIVTTWPC